MAIDINSTYRMSCGWFELGIPLANRQCGTVLFA
jgi:hypothetical protein